MSDEALTPVLSVLAKPVTSLRNGIDSAGHFFEVYRENDRLRADNAALTEWRDTALRLEAGKRGAAGGDARRARP